MHSYAQTNIQLYNQLRDDGYTDDDLDSVRKAYELAVLLLTCRYQHSGKTTIAHFVGTASILSSLHVPAKLVAAGLLHNVYKIGDFGDGRKGITNSRREQVIRTVGVEVEEYAARYLTMRWNKRTIPTICDGLEGLASMDREVVLIHLADHLEHHLDCGILYFDDAKRRGFVSRNDRLHIMIEIAEKLGFPALATELSRVITGCAFVETSVVSPNPDYWNENTRRIPPQSYCLRSSIVFIDICARLRRRIRSALRAIRSV